MYLQRLIIVKYGCEKYISQFEIEKTCSLEHFVLIGGGGGIKHFIQSDVSVEFFIGMLDVISPATFIQSISVITKVM